MFHKKVFPLAVIGILLTCPASLRSQETTGNISGSVTDSTGGTVPDANVVVTNVLTGADRSTTTTSAGIFFFTNLAVGDYQLTVQKTGFKTSEITGIHLNVNDKLTFPVKLELGSANESITVTGETQLLQTESAEVSNLIGNAQMKALPLNGRNFAQLVDLVPGVAPDNGRIGAGDTAVSINGALSNSNLYLVDGTFDMDNGSNGDLLVAPPVDSIEEFKILRNNYSAEFGEATGAIVNVVTKSGGKDFHGSLYEFVRNDAFDATDFFATTDSQGNKLKDKLRQHDYGFTVGGPAWIPKLYNNDRKKDFFFVATEFRRQIRGNIIKDNVPTQRQRTGVLDPTCAFANAQIPPLPCTAVAADPQELVPQTTFHDPNFPNDPSKTITVNGEQNFNGVPDPNAVAFLSRYPLPNHNAVNPDGSSTGFNYSVSSPATNNSNLVAIRWDHVIGDKATLMVSFTRRNGAQLNLNTTNWGDDSFPSVSSDWFGGGELGTVKLTNFIGPRTVNDFQFGYSNNYIRWQTSKVSDPVLASRAGFTYTELFPETNGSFPSMPNGLPEGFGAIQHTAPFYNRTDNFQYRDDITHSFGKNNLKLGGFLRFSRKREPANGGDNETAGAFTFLSLGDLLAGNVSSYTEEKTNNEVPSRGKDIAVYFQDTYKVLPNLTLDIGLRWQYLGQVYSAKNNISSFYPSRYDKNACSVAAIDANGLVNPALCAPLNGIVTPQSPGVNRALKQPHYNDWEPRVGIAWDPFSTHKLVLRVGGGIYHGRDAFSQNSTSGRQPPFDLLPVLNNTSFTALAPFDPTTPQPPLNLNVLDPNYPSPQSYQYSLGFQYKFMPDSSIEVNYVGSRQIHLGRNVNINQVPLSAQPGVANFLINVDPNTGTPCTDITLPCINPDTVRPFLGYSIINVNQRSAVSRYNSLQVFVNHQMGHGLAFQGAYTYSRNIGTSGNQDSEGRARPVQDSYHPDLEKSVTDQDIPHSLVMNFVWELPFFQKSTGFRKVLLGDWQMNGIATFRSGRPVDVCLNQDNAGLGDSAICERPNITGNPVLSDSKRTLGRYFNVDAFSVPTLGTFGNGGKNPIRGPGINTWDMSFFKSLVIPWFGRHDGWAARESAKIEFRAEMFNIFNHTQFGNPHATLGNGNFGTIDSTSIGPREVQFGLRLEF